MFGTDNSIEPVRAVAAVAVTADGRRASHAMIDKSSIREATADDLAAAARRARSTAAAEPSPVQAVPEARGSFFRRRPADADKPDAVAQQHGLYTTAKGSTRRYYADYQQKREVMRANTTRISTKRDDAQTVTAMLDLAQSRGWNTVRLKGTADFQREAWVQAQVRGMKVEGYKPTATDQQEAARRKAAVAPVQAPPVQVASATAAKSTPLPADAPAERAKAAPVTVAVAPTPHQATATRRSDAAAPDKAKMTPVQRSKAVWGAVEATGKQARAADAATVKATAGERPTAATVS